MARRGVSLSRVLVFPSRHSRARSSAPSRCIIRSRATRRRATSTSPPYWRTRRHGYLTAPNGARDAQAPTSAYGGAPTSAYGGSKRTYGGHRRRTEPDPLRRMAVTHHVLEATRTASSVL